MKITGTISDVTVNRNLVIFSLKITAMFNITMQNLGVHHFKI